MATAKAVAAGNSCRQEDVIATANLSRRAIADMLRSCKVGPVVISQEGGHGQEQWGVRRGGRHWTSNLVGWLEKAGRGTPSNGALATLLQEAEAAAGQLCGWRAGPLCVGLAIICPSLSRKLHAIQMWAVRCGTEPCALARSVLVATWSFWNTSSW